MMKEMMKMTVKRVEQHLIDEKHELFEIIDEYSFLSKNLYNYANYHIRQVFIITSKLNRGEAINKEQQEFLDNINAKVDEYNKYKEANFKKAQLAGKKAEKVFKPLDYFHANHKYIGYEFLEYIVSEGSDYKSIMAQSAQQTLKLLDKNWVSFFGSIKDYKINPDKYTGMPKLPKYKHKTKGRANIIFTNQNCKLADGMIQFPNCFKQYKLKTKVTEQLQQVRIKPLGSQYLIEIVYKKEISVSANESKNIVGLDLGLNNLVTMANNIGLKPIVINGRVIKSINQYYNKRIAGYKSILKKENGKDWSRKLSVITNNRNNRIKDLMHKTSSFIIKYCVNNNIDTIVVGNNKNWKQEINLGSVNNQNFVQIPYSMLIEQLQYKAEDNGLKCIVTEESYTSKASFLDFDFMPVYDSKADETVREFSGKRIHRGLYKSKNGTLINADVNGSLNIIRKVFPNGVFDGIEGVGLHPVRLNVV